MTPDSQTARRARNTPPAGNGAPRYLGAGGTFRLEPPRLRTTADPLEGRHATWFELFFDLVFVAAVSQLGGALALDPSAPVFARFAALFVVVVWAWVLYTLYANRFDTDNLIFRLAKSGAMLAIAAIAVSLHEAMDGRGGTVGFAAEYVRALLIGLYVRARRHVDGQGRRLTKAHIVGYSATTALWLISIFVPSPFRYALWTVAMAIDLAIPTRAWAVLKGHSVVISHLTERFGTFFIIVLGESVVAVVAGIAGFELTIESWIVGGLGFVIALCLWWIYFDLADTSVVGRGALGLVYVYSHFPLLAGVAAFGEGTQARNHASGATRPGSGGPMGAGRRNRGIRTVAGSAPYRSRVDFHARPQLRRPDRPRRPGPHTGGSWWANSTSLVRRGGGGRRTRAATHRGLHRQSRRGDRRGTPSRPRPTSAASRTKGPRLRRGP